MSIKKTLGLSALFTVTALSAAEAHVGAGSVTGFTAGFGHPVGGLDHVLAMVAVGVLAAQQGGQMGGRALWLIPASFVAMMMVGATMGMTGVALPFVELGILGSIIVLGTIVALGRTLPLGAAMALVGFLSIFHGHAHGTEMPVDAVGLTYGLGFAVATSALHATGIAAAIAMQRFAHKAAPRLVRVGGAVITALGLTLLAGS